ncbi:MAG: amino acid ABC transporter permease [Pseudolabrys sp.]|nr:amino acid ABC transporter permease [Pseudolabrys sp.]MBV9261403.1 amino acid ABC transporter permease [Pseudolabrys sp.]
MNDFQFTRILVYLPDLLRGVGVTFQIGLVSASIGLVLGLVLALMKFSRHPLAYWPAYVYVEFFRTTPPLIQIVWLYYGLPLITGQDLGAFGAAAVALGLNVSAFYSEIYRAGLVGVHRTQWQASRVLGLSLSDTLRFVIVPQAVRNVLPPMGTTTIYLIKDTALASAIGTPELLRIGQLISVETFRPVETLTMVAILYFAVTYPVALFVDWLERRFKIART